MKLGSTGLVTARVGLMLTITWLASAAYLPHRTTAAIVGAAWADHEGCNCQSSDSNRGCYVVSDGFCGGGWVTQCQSVILNPPTGTCIKLDQHPCGPADPANPNGCGFIQDETC